MTNAKITITGGALRVVKASHGGDSFTDTATYYVEIVLRCPECFGRIDKGHRWVVDEGRSYWECIDPPTPTELLAEMGATCSTP